MIVNLPKYVHRVRWPYISWPAPAEAPPVRPQDWQLPRLGEYGPGVRFLLRTMPRLNLMRLASPMPINPAAGRLRGK